MLIYIYKYETNFFLILNLNVSYPYLSYLWFSFFKNYKHYIFLHFFGWSYISVQGVYLYRFWKGILKENQPISLLKQVLNFVPKKVETVFLHVYFAIIDQ